MSENIQVMLIYHIVVFTYTEKFPLDLIRKISAYFYCGGFKVFCRFILFGGLRLICLLVRSNVCWKMWWWNDCICRVLKLFADSKLNLILVNSFVFKTYFLTLTNQMNTWRWSYMVFYYQVVICSLECIIWWLFDHSFFVLTVALMPIFTAL